MNKLFVGALAVFGLLASAFAFGGFQEMGNGIGEISREVHISFMKAMHEGDYETAKSMNKEYGVGGRMMESATEETFSLRAQMQSAMQSGDYESAYDLGQELRALAKENMQEQGFWGMKRMRMRNEGTAGADFAGMGFEGKCPFAQSE